jgi:hypothetical protein
MEAFIGPLKIAKAQDTHLLSEIAAVISSKKKSDYQSIVSTMRQA